MLVNLRYFTYDFFAPVFLSLAFVVHSLVVVITQPIRDSTCKYAYTDKHCDR